MDLQTFIAPEIYNISQEIERHHSEKTALIWLDEQGCQKTISYSELIQDANRIANALAKLGIVKGDRVLIMTTRLLESYAIYLACLKSGIIMIPSSEMLRAKDLAYRINHAQAKAVISYAPFTAEFENITSSTPSLEFKLAFGGEAANWASLDKLKETEPDQFETVPTHKDDYALFSYTSGTTGQPKAVVHSHGWGFAHTVSSFLILSQRGAAVRI